LARLLRLKALRSRAYLKESGSIKNSLRKARQHLRRGQTKAARKDLSKGKLLLLGGGLAVAVLFFIITAIAGHAPKKQIAAKPQAQQQKQSRNEAGQRQRHACYGHCAYRRAGQFGRPAWPRRHPEDTRIDGSEGAPIEFRRNGEACYGKATSRANAGERADVRADTTEVGRSRALWRSIKSTQPRRTSSKTH
jgi:hypothetical protein